MAFGVGIGNCQWAIDIEEQKIYWRERSNLRRNESKNEAEMRRMERLHHASLHRQQKRLITGRLGGSRDLFCERTRQAEAAEFMLERIRRAQKANEEDEEEEDDERPLRAAEIRRSVGCQGKYNKEKTEKSRKSRFGHVPFR